MGRRPRSGPPPKPPQLKSITGGRKSDLQARVGDGVKMTPGIPDRPELFNEESEAEWDRLIEELDPYGLISLADRGMLVLLCNAWGRYQMASRLVAEPGGMENEHGQASPALTTLERAQNAYYKIALEFGMSPSARSRVAVQPKKTANKWAEKKA